MTYISRTGQTVHIHCRLLCNSDCWDSIYVRSCWGRIFRIDRIRSLHSITWSLINSLLTHMGAGCRNNRNITVDLPESTWQAVWQTFCISKCKAHCVSHRDGQGGCRLLSMSDISSGEFLFSKVFRTADLLWLITSKCIEWAVASLSGFNSCQKMRVRER